MALARKGFLSAMIPLLLASPAAASSAVCEDIFRQLSRSRVETIGATEDARRYAGAIARQNIVIRRLKNNLRQAGCSSGSIVVYGGGMHQESCRELDDRLMEAEDEVQDLLARRDQAMRHQPAMSERQMLLAALSANGCDEEEPVQASVTPDQDGLPATDGSIIRFPSQSGTVQQGGLRTLCVRTCDGAFFPISANASPLDFARQTQQCAAMCPGAETELYYHSLTDQESADMVSAQTGRPYRELPTAFAYRSQPRSSSPQCGCNMAAYQREVKQENSSPAKPGEPYSGITRINPPEAQQEAESLAAPPEREYRPEDGNVRMVGPQFLPTENSRIDLSNPALKGAQPLQ